MKETKGFRSKWALRTTAAVGTGLIALGVAVAGGGMEAPHNSDEWRSKSTFVAVASGPATEKLARLPVKGRAPKTGYSREKFGQRWADIDRNGCDQRNDVLARDLDSVTYKPGTDDCVVLSGVLDPDPYTGAVIQFERGAGSSSAVQIDHIVAVSDAWQSGAQQLDAVTRERFANDPDNLRAVDGPTNARKGDGDAATWLPPRREFWCEYGTRQVEIKTRYRLWVKPAERDALARLLDTCPGAPLAALLPAGVVHGEPAVTRTVAARPARRVSKG
ncbi:hypothetical protein GCM10009613_65630 [Pseudonocardia kongjuensis]|uniref:GmrSD restriction endonucleases C-terminal domain-containing protein n=1 Tax=Pseudonocardia kongjuensis TaxID=102227 RepID=A0ABP4J4N7_9PSEU